MRTVGGEGAWGLAGFELAPRGAQRLAAFTCVGCLGESAAGGVDTRALRCSEPHTCAFSRFGRVSLDFWRLLVDAEQFWAVCLETAVSLLSHDFSVANTRSRAQVGLFCSAALKSYYTRLVVFY